MNTATHDILHTSPFHEGEQRVQERLGVREAIEPWARQVVRPLLPEEHRAFHGALPFLVAAARDDLGRPWVTLLAGDAGFVASPDPGHLTIAARPVPGDALEGALAAGADVGLLGIELATRRRNRVNGTLEQAGDAGLVFRVGQSFGNCPQYIHAREWRRVAVPEPRPAARRASALDAAQQAWIAGADTLFVASGHRGESAHPGYGMDASHRGGEPGFVEVVDGTRLVIPDYAGNNHFNTLGNLVQDPRVGLLFVDFAGGGMLQLSGRASIDWAPADRVRHPGARRLVTVEVDAVVELPGALPLRWSADGGALRSLRVTKVVRESEDVASLVLASRDGGPLPDFTAGQHLPLRLQLPGTAERARRTYSLSGAPGAGHYRISVKREAHGLVSRLLHDVVAPGSIVEAEAPAGDFVLSHAARPAVLASAGVGLTPMVSMLHAAAAAGRRAWFVHGARDGAHHPLRGEVARLVEAHAHLHAHVAYSRPRPGDAGAFDSEGRVDGALLARLLPDLDADFYLCGPAGFLADLAADLRARGVPEARIHVEQFAGSV